jgi:hypothetical protein
MSSTISPSLDPAKEILIYVGNFQMSCDSSNLAENGCNVYECIARQDSTLPNAQPLLRHKHIWWSTLTGSRRSPSVCGQASGC